MAVTCEVTAIAEQIQDTHSEDSGAEMLLLGGHRNKWPDPRAGCAPEDIEAGYCCFASA